MPVQTSCRMRSFTKSWAVASTGLDLGAEHINPDGKPVGEKHKNYWVPGYRDKWAYEPGDITEPWHRPVAVWAQFCAEIHLRHTGTLSEPRAC